MKKDFDFDDIGKRTPYRVPEGFFEEMQCNVRKHTYGNHQRKRRVWTIISTSIAVAAMLIGFFFFPSRHWQDAGDISGMNILETENCTAVTSTEKWIREISDEELEELVSFSENDIFLN